MDNLIRLLWKLYHNYDKYINFISDNIIFNTFKSINISDEFDDIVLSDTEKIIFYIPYPTNIGVESIELKLYIYWF